MKKATKIIVMVSGAHSHQLLHSVIIRLGMKHFRCVERIQAQKAVVYKPRDNNIFNLEDIFPKQAISKCNRNGIYITTG